MPIVVCNDAELYMLDLIRNEFNADTIEVGLFKAAHTPVGADTLATYAAIEADFDAYARILLPATWSAPVLAGGKAITVAGLAQWICGGAVTPNDIYGIFALNFGTGVLMFAEEFVGGPVTMDSLGDVVAYTPSLTLFSES